MTDEQLNEIRDHLMRVEATKCRDRTFMVAAKLLAEVDRLRDGCRAAHEMLMNAEGHNGDYVVDHDDAMAVFTKLNDLGSRPEWLKKETP